ncbi:MAG: Na(+)-translocating NADH-quinone reductase subunit A [Myxococcales bacterium]|nr:Na(+)-translocating NADH-quinone reductase subunit A [Myxococcales bacterium]
MAHHQIKKGLDLPIKGRPKQEIGDGKAVEHVALLNHDYPFMKPRMCVNEGDVVQRGQILFEDRKGKGINFTAPAAGKISNIHRGERRAFLSIVIELDDSEKDSKKQPKHVEFSSYKGKKLEDYNGEQARALLSESGMLTAFRTRPYDRVPSMDETCHAIFVTAIDTNPLAPSVEVALKGKEDDFKLGLKVLPKLTEGKIFLCTGKDWKVDTKGIDKVQTETFEGPHPAGLVGTHIHFLYPVSRQKTVWHINYQDVVALGHLFRTGKLSVERVISIAGPGAKEPKLVKTRVGASIAELTKGKLAEGEGLEVRTISGSVIFGYNTKDETTGYLSRYHNQVSCILEDRERVFMGWLRPGSDKFSLVRAYLSKWIPGMEPKEYDFTTTTNGSHRAMVPIGMFERVMPLDILPTFLLRSLLMGDLERAEQLGCLELHEEDLALCSFVSPGKEEYGKALRKVLTEMWQEG